MDRVSGVRRAMLAVSLALALGLTVPSSSMANRITAPACAHTAPRGVAPNAWRAARSELAPPGAVSVRLCRYAGQAVGAPLRRDVFNGDIDRVFPNHAAERLGNALIRLT